MNMADTSSANYDRSLTDPWIKPDDTALQKRRDSKSSHEVRNINKNQIPGIDRERIGNELVADINKKNSTEKRENIVNGNTEKEINSNILDENDLDEYDPDLIITEEEQKAFEYMLAQKREEMDKRDEMFENWVDRFTRRRMFALSRMRKLNKGRLERMKFYSHVDNYVKSVETVFNSESSLSVLPEGESEGNGTNSSGNQAETQKESRETTKNVVREDTINVPKETTSNTARETTNNNPRETTNNIPREDTGIISTSENNNNTIAQNSISSNKESAETVVSNSEQESNNNNKETPVIVPVKS